MTLVACSVTVDRPDLVTPALERAAAARADGADLVEWRIDLLAMMPGADGAIARLVRDSPLPCILTVRSEAEGGAFDGSPIEAVRVLAAAVRCGHPPRFIDAEARMLQDAHAGPELHAALATLDDGARPSLIVSMHDHAGRPASLWSSLERMWADRACSVAKVAWTARTLRDNLEAFDVLASRQGPTIALCMGEQGVLSRVMGAKFGAFLTFARLDDEQGTAPGQPTVRELVDRYRVKGITRHTRVYGIVGWPVSHSRGPIVHNAWFGQLGLDARYLPLPVGPSWESFKASMSELVDHPALDLAGASVTLPHKEHLVRFVRERGGHVDAIAARIGAANTLLVEPGGAVSCTNTDAPAAVDALCEGMGIERAALREKRVAVLGAGGVARAVAAGLADEGARVVVFNRNEDRARAMCEDLMRGTHDDGNGCGPFEGRIVAGRASEIGCGCFHAFVNCTPVGMAGGPEPDGIPLPDEVPLDGSVTVMDTVYAPRETPLLRVARSRGARTVDGWSMFTKQAERQSRLWRVD